MKIIKYHITLVKNLVNSAESSDKSLIILCFDLMTESYYNNADQNSYNAIESYFSFF